jgi:hypothetical protein
MMWSIINYIASFFTNPSETISDVAIERTAKILVENGYSNGSDELEKPIILVDHPAFRNDVDKKE